MDPTRAVVVDEFIRLVGIGDVDKLISSLATTSTNVRS